jgi:hypothetical protein
VAGRAARGRDRWITGANARRSASQRRDLRGVPLAQALAGEFDAIGCGRCGRGWRQRWWDRRSLQTAPVWDGQVARVAPVEKGSARRRKIGAQIGKNGSADWKSLQAEELQGDYRSMLSRRSAALGTDLAEVRASLPASIVVGRDGVRSRGRDRSTNDLLS